MTRQITLNFGVGTRADGLPLTERETVQGLAEIERAALKLFGGFTCLPTAGGWIAPDGRTHSESGIMLEVLTEQDIATASANAKLLAVTIKRALGQACILLRVAEVTAEFVA